MPLALQKLLIFKRLSVPRAPLKLVAEPKTLDQVLITRKVSSLQVLKKFAALSDHDEKSAARMEVLLMKLHVLRKLADTRGQDCNLNFGGAGVCVMHFEFFDQLLFLFLTDHIDHSCTGLLRPFVPELRPASQCAGPCSGQRV